MGCEVLITQDEAWRRGTTVPLKRTADEAVAEAPGRQDVRRAPAHRQRRADDATAATTGGTSSRPTSRRRARRSRWTPRTCSTCSTRRGTTAKPKGIAHTTGGYLVGAATTHHYVFDLKPETDVYWCAADVGWVTGHSYIVYGPLCNGATSVMYEGTPDFPDKDRWWDDRRALRRDDPLHGADGDPHAHEVGAGARGRSTTSRRCACSARSASRSTPRRGSGTTSTSAAAAARSSTRGGRPRPG